MKHRINFAIEQELIDAAKEYAKQEYTSITNLVRQYFLQLKRELERKACTRGRFPLSADNTASGTSHSERSEANDSPQTSEAEAQ